MKRTLIALAVLAISLGAAASDSSNASPLVGAWSVDTARLSTPAGARPKSVTITFSMKDAAHLGTRVEVVSPAGSRLLAEGVTPLDGSPTAIPPNFEADVSATTMPTPEVLIMQLAKDGVPASTRIYTVHAGGDSMTETVAYFDSDGRPVTRRNFLSRIR